MSTTVEILAPYLPYGIPMATPKGPAKLLGLNDGNFQCPVEALLFEPEPPTESLLSGRYNWDYKEVTPMLLGFNSLCTPLEDGTVPAREVARIMLATKQPFGRTIDLPSNGVHVRSGNARVNAFLVDRDSNNVGAAQIIIDENYDIEIEDHSGALRYGSLIAAYDYLRSKHFALPVNGKHLVEGVDYIRKA